MKLKFSRVQSSYTIQSYTLQGGVHPQGDFHTGSGHTNLAWKNNFRIFPANTWQETLLKQSHYGG